MGSGSPRRSQRNTPAGPHKLSEPSAAPGRRAATRPEKSRSDRDRLRSALPGACPNRACGHIRARTGNRCPDGNATGRFRGSTRPARRGRSWFWRADRFRQLGTRFFPVYYGRGAKTKIPNEAIWFLETPRVGVSWISAFDATDEPVANLFGVTIFSSVLRARREDKN